MKVFEITGALFDGGSDVTDAHVLWVAAVSEDIVRSAIADTGATFCGVVDTNDDPDYILPEQEQALREMLTTGFGPDKDLTAEQLDDKYNPDGDGEHPGHTRSDWVWAVQNRDTISGYWVWVAYQLTQDDD